MLRYKPNLPDQNKQEIGYHIEYTDPAFSFQNAYHSIRKTTARSYIKAWCLKHLRSLDNAVC